ncbi:MAG: hydrogenase large subunit [Acidiferrobacterales bacterium]
MKRFDWLDPFLGRLLAEEVAVRELPANSGLAPARAIGVEPDHWGRFGQAARHWGCRWVGCWGDDLEEHFHLYACFEKDHGYLLARTTVRRLTPILPSHAPYFPAADRAERHLQDLFGVAFSDHPDPRRWIRHQAWKDSDYPLRKDFPLAGHPQPQTPADSQYKFLFAQGAGVYEIPVGPVHASIIEPGHFRFQAVGETVLHLEERLGYTHKGTEKLAEGRDAAGLARLAARVSGDSTVAHSWAACMAMEKAAGIGVPARALALRAIMAERERIANHLGDIGTICNDVSFSFAFYQFTRLRELWQRVNREAFGHRLLMDRVIPGGVAADLTPESILAQREQIRVFRPQLVRLMDILNTSPTVEDRLIGTGRLSHELAAEFGALGYVGRASGIDRDVRRDSPYAPYDALTTPVPVRTGGDVAARVRVRAEEISHSFALMEKLFDDLPPGPTYAPWAPPAGDAVGLGLVEGWRGETLAFVRFDKNGCIARYYPRDPSVINWPLLELLINENIVPDFPVCNKSVNGSYSGNDL